jgi:uncharacterized RDD family membrane protein YckC
MNWYYVERGQQAGPVEDAQLEQMRATGQIQGDTLVWHEGMTSWQAYREVKGGAVPPPPPPPGGLRLSTSPAAVASPVVTEAVCAECGNIFAKENMIRYGNSWVCANCKPAFVQKLAEGARINTGELRYAGFWIRFAAKFLDGLILGIVVIIPVMVVFVLMAVRMPGSNGSQSHLTGDISLHAATSTGMPDILANIFGVFVQLILIAANAVYAGFFVGKYGATPGKMACKLIVVDTAGQKISYGRAFGRGFAEILSRIVCNIGYIIAAFDSQKRALHDHICGTRVIYKE